MGWNAPRRAREPRAPEDAGPAREGFPRAGENPSRSRAAASSGTAIRCLADSPGTVENIPGVGSRAAPGGIMLVPKIKKLYDIDPRSWEHPADRAALAALRSLKGLDELVSTILSVTSEKSLRLMHLASAIKVTERQYSRIFRLMAEVTDTFDWPFTPTVFVKQSVEYNAGVLGAKEPFIVLNSYLLRNFDETEVKAILAHEMGHIMSGHAPYKTLIWMLARISPYLLGLPKIVLIPIFAALYEWDRKSELTADRAEVLALQDETPSLNALMRMAGGEDLSEVDINEFFLQAREFDEQKSLLDSVHKMFNQLWQSHPFPVERIQELRTWSASGAFGAILDGNYLKRGYSAETPEEDIKAGFEFYKRDMEDSEDPLTRLASNLGKGIEKAAGNLEDAFKELFKP